MKVLNLSNYFVLINEAESNGKLPKVDLPNLDLMSKIRKNLLSNKKKKPY